MQLNLARNRFPISPFPFLLWKWRSRTRRTCGMWCVTAFEVQTSHTKLVKKQLTPVRFNYPTGLLFLEIVWKTFVKPQRNHKNKIRFYDGHGSQIRLSSIQEAAVQLYNCSHTVAWLVFAIISLVWSQLIGLLSSQPELHRWIREHKSLDCQIANYLALVRVPVLLPLIGISIE
jgi:hypothetical protein